MHTKHAHLFSFLLDIFSDLAVARVAPAFLTDASLDPKALGHTVLELPALAVPLSCPPLSSLPWPVVVQAGRQCRLWHALGQAWHQSPVCSGFSGRSLSLLERSPIF